jgi:predicted DNA-binding transcriptional regulator YafY
MLETSARLLRLLSLLQARRDWTGEELAERLEVTARTVRRDVDKLRSLGYPVNASGGVAGGYHLGAGAALPPLLLDDDEAVAVAIGLRTAAAGSVAGMEETSVRALVKLEQLLPARLRHRINALRTATVPLTGPTSAVDPDVLTVIAAACRDHQRLHFRYRSRAEPVRARVVEPHRLVYAPHRWYLVAFDTDRQDWRTFRVDRIDSPPMMGRRFRPRTPPEDAATYVSQTVSSAPYRYHARILMHAPIEVVADRVSPMAGRLAVVDEHTCVLHTGSNSLDALAIYVGLKGVDFEVLDPPELVKHIRALGRRLSRAAAS